MDDKYADDAISTIATNDLFYVVEDGPCDVLRSATAATTAEQLPGFPVTPSALGTIHEDGPSTGQYIVGVLDEGVATTSTKCRIIVHPGLAQKY